MTGVIISLFAYWSCVSICSSHLHYCPGIYVFMLFLTFIILIFSNLFYLFPEVRKIWFYELQRMCYPIYIFSLFGNMCSTFGIKIMAGLSGCGLFSYALISISFARLGSHGKFLHALILCHYLCLHYFLNVTCATHGRGSLEAAETAISTASEWKVRK